MMVKFPAHKLLIENPDRICLLSVLTEGLLYRVISDSLILGIDMLKGLFWDFWGSLMQTYLKHPILTPNSSRNAWKITIDYGCQN